MASYGFLLSGGAYTTLNVPGAMQTQARGINDFGQISGMYATNFSSSFPRHGFLFSSGQYSSLDVPGSIETIAEKLNNPGQIVGAYTVCVAKIIDANRADPDQLL